MPSGFLTEEQKQFNGGRMVLPTNGIGAIRHP